IDPLAQIFIDHDFEIVPVLETLLSSEHFFDTTFRGCIVKNPVEFFIGSMIQFNVLEESNLIDNHEIWIDFYVQLGFLAMDPGNPPSVAGWPAYYQPPKFHQWWINSSSLNLRAKIVSDLCTKEGLFYNGFTFKFHFIPFVSNFEHPEDEHILVENCISFLFSVAINDSEKEKLTDLLNGQANQQESWTELWKSYQNKKDDIEKRESTENRLREFFKRLLNLPEFQMM
ncbi:MAG: DUF1800 family protein, partial [Chitinophagales bacterium]|nr:DUF1800 family protein [Chitinophagales bacterium]